LKVTLIGADGQLGDDIFKTFKSAGIDITGLTISDIDICKSDICRDVLCGLKPDLIINTAAYNLVDTAEDEPVVAFDVNAAGVRNVCQVCIDTGAALMHFSTDYVFGGYTKDEPYNETDCPAPVGIYGLSKLAGEYIVKYMLQKYFIVRVSGLYGHKGCLGKGYNFVDLMIDLAGKQKEITAVNDQVMTPTSTKDVSFKLIELINTGRYGTYHMTNTGSCSWFDFASEIFLLMNIRPDIKPIKTIEFKTKAKRPFYSVLDNRNLRDAGLEDMRHWKDALRDYIGEKYGK
jgi:dTDP-4-dehydrorhamnose reductase